MTVQIANILLSDIASWQLPTVESKSNIIAKLPALQRGAVWKPNQIELLWDSIFRGFPIGAVVLSKRHERIYAHEKSSYISNGADERKITHHLLDGQQRSNAIALGFYLPDYGDEKTNNMLWLDLMPSERKNSTRQFVLRVCTAAHPWGFALDDNASKISQAEIYNFGNIYNQIFPNAEQNVNARPKVAKSIPQLANIPIPLGLLLKFFDGEQFNWENALRDQQAKEWIDAIDCWQEEKGKTKLSQFFEDSTNQEQWQFINAALKKAKETVLPVSYINLSNENNAINDIELIFSRINNQGTPISQEELQYSLIKAYYPEVEQWLSKLQLPVGEARLITLGIRAFQMVEQDGKYHGNLSIEQVRKLFTSEQKDKAKDYLKTNIPKMLDWIHENLIYSAKNSIGLPPYIRSSIAWSSDELFLWWFKLAEQFEFKEINQEIKQKILAVSLVIHWFGYDKNKIFRKLWDLWFESEDKDKDLLQWKIKGLDDENNLPPLVKPDDLKDELLVRIDEVLKEDSELSDENRHSLIDLWSFLIRLDKQGKWLANENEQSLYWLVKQIWHKQEILVYIQRDELSKMDFDPSNRILWDSHNRPWDYDHILPTARLNAQGSGWEKYTGIAKLFQQSIGNQMALPFSINRSKSDNEVELDKEPYLTAFNLGNKEKVFDFENIFKTFTLVETNDIDKTKEYTTAVAKRFSKIYQILFETLNMQTLMNE